MGKIYASINNRVFNLECNDNTKLLSTKDLIICIDGEINNKEEICEKLDINYTSDVELLKELYIKYNEEFINKIEGFFVIALYDKEKNKLFLIRDKIGTKQLYYYIKNNDICFASELKAIIKYPEFEKKINYNALSRYFRYTYINPPQTIFENTYKIEHGHYIVWQNGKIQNKTYWDGIEKFNDLSKHQIKDFQEAKTNLEDMIKKYLEMIIRSNNNFGIYLSGGVDSSLVAAICSKISKSPVNTFSIGFFEKERNEAENAKKIAEYLKTNHHEIYIGEDKLLETIKKVPEYYDEPFSDASEIPTIILNEFACKNNIKIAITGDGADQLFCGSTIYDKIYRREKIFNPLNIKLEWKIIKNTKLHHIYANNNPKNQTQSDIEYKEKQFNGLFRENDKKRYNFEDKINSKNWQVKRMMIDVNTFLPNRINTKTNRPSNTNGIEIKSPFLANNIIEYSFKIPQKYKYHKKNKKYIFKQILYKYIPEELFDKKKRGFGVPISKWLTTYLYQDLMRVSNKEFIEKQNIFNYEKLSELLEKIKNDKYQERVSQILWNLYIFQLWYIKYFENKM